MSLFSKKKIKIEESSLKDLGQIELVGTAKTLLDSSIQSAEALSGKPYDPHSLKSGKLVLGFLNATIHALRAKTSVFKLTDTRNKVSAVRSHIRRASSK